jgi:hypothetical protein
MSERERRELSSILSRRGSPSDAPCVSVAQTSFRLGSMCGKQPLRRRLTLRAHDHPLRNRDAAPNGANSEGPDRAGDPADEEIAPYDRPRLEVEPGAVPRAHDRRSADRSLIEGTVSVSAQSLEAVQSTRYIENCHDAPVQRHPHRRSGRRNGSRCDGFRTCGVAESPVLTRRCLAP